MEIIASSAQHINSYFLHAGYLSALPRSMASPWVMRRVQEIFAYFQPTLKLNVAEALRLKEEANAAALHVQTANLWPLPTMSSWDNLAMLLGVSTLLFTIAAIYAVKNSPQHKRKLRCAIFGLIALFCLISIGGIEGIFSRSAKPPWATVEPRTYVNPEAATQTILHGIIADGLINSQKNVRALSDIQNEIGLPSKKLTEGQQYALATYGLDGWGNPFRLSREGGSFFSRVGRKYHVQSAGKDGVYGSSDDIRITVPAATNESWEKNRWAFFIKREGNEYFMLVHRWTGSYFEFSDGNAALRLTGGKLFDAVKMDETTIKSAYDQIAPTSSDPLLMFIFSADDYQSVKAS